VELGAGELLLPERVNFRLVANDRTKKPDGNTGAVYWGGVSVDNERPEDLLAIVVNWRLGV